MADADAAFWAPSGQTYTVRSGGELTISGAGRTVTVPAEDIAVLTLAVADSRRRVEVTAGPGRAAGSSWFDLLDERIRADNVMHAIRWYLTDGWDHDVKWIRDTLLAEHRITHPDDPDEARYLRDLMGKLTVGIVRHWPRQAS